MNRILIVKLHALGDFVIATPAIRRLKETLPQTRLDLLTTEWTAPAAVGNPDLNQIIAAPDSLFFKPKPASGAPLLSLLYKLRRRSYDAAVIFHVHPAIDAFIALAGISRRFRFGRKAAGRCVLLDEDRHSALTNCELVDEALSELTGRREEPARLADLRYRWFIQEEEKRTASLLLGEVGLEPGSFISVFPGGGSNPGADGLEKRWGLAHFQSLVQRITRELPYAVALMGGNSDVEAAEQVKKAVGEGVVNLCGQLPMRISAAVMAQSTAAVSNDSGPLHIAAAVGVPCVGLFGPTGIEHKLPPGPFAVGVSSGLPCSPCYFTVFKGCLFDSIRCLENLTVERVLQGLKMALKGTVSA